MSLPHDSLDRFLRARADEIVGSSTVRLNAKFQIGIGGSLLLIAIALAAGALLRGPGQLAFGAIGPGIAGFINLSIGIYMFRRILPSPVGQVEYSPEARELVRALWRAHGSPPAEAILAYLDSNTRKTVRAAWAIKGPQPSDEILTYLERAAQAYQRMSASIALNRSQPPLNKLIPRVAIAAEEAMAEAFHQAATLIRYPEGSTLARRALESQIRILEEIVLRLEELAAHTSTALGPNRSSADDLLTDLRLEALARSELSQVTEGQQQSQRSQ